MSWRIGSITLPIAPYKTELRNTANIKEFMNPGEAYALILSFGRKGRILRIDGHLYNPGWTKDQLDTTYITVLEGYVGKVKTISAPGTRYDGSWMLTTFTYQETKGNVWSYDYRMEFIQGSSMHEV